MPSLTRRHHCDFKNQLPAGDEPARHFIDNAGLCAAVDSLDTIEEARVGVFTDFGPMPTEAQLSSVLLLAEMATVRNPSIEIAFGAGTSPSGVAARPFGSPQRQGMNPTPLR